MSNELPIAVVTVHFVEAPVTGLQLAALVQQVIERRNRRFAVRHRYHDVELLSFGQVSYDRDEHIRVTPCPSDYATNDLSPDGLPFFKPERAYSEAKVTSHFWGGDASPLRNDQAVIAAVKSFAEQLAAAYEAALTDRFPEYAEH